MKLYDQYHAYLEGSSFSTSLMVKIAQPVQRVDDRVSLLEREARGKKVIDLGCADYPKAIESKLKQDVWLHGRLSRCAEKCLGIDINLEGIKFLQEKMNCKDVIYGDILNDVIDEIKAERWDLIILGEVLEHIDNPVLFLNTIHHNYAGNIDKMVVTVPNAFALLNQHKSLEGLEIINSDHRFWFTPYTLAKVLLRSGFRLGHYQFCERYHAPPANIGAKVQNILSVREILLKTFPALMNTIVFWAHF